MFIDSLGLLSDAQAVAATAVSTNTIDLGDVTPKREVGSGEPLAMVVCVDVAADATTGDETYQFNFVSDDAAALSSVTVLAERLISRTLLTAGSIHVVPVPPGTPSERYIGAQYVLGGTTPSITVTTFLTLQSMLQMFKAYADGFTVS